MAIETHHNLVLNFYDIIALNFPNIFDMLIYTLQDMDKYQNNLLV